MKTFTFVTTDADDDDTDTTIKRSVTLDIPEVIKLSSDFQIGFGLSQFVRCFSVQPCFVYGDSVSERK